MVGDKEMEKLMNDDIVPEIPVKLKKFGQRLGRTGLAVLVVLLDSVSPLGHGNQIRGATLGFCRFLDTLDQIDDFATITTFFMGDPFCS